MNCQALYSFLYANFYTSSPSEIFNGCALTLLAYDQNNFANSALLVNNLVCLKHCSMSNACISVISFILFTDIHLKSEIVQTYIENHLIYKNLREIKNFYLHARRLSCYPKWVKACEKFLPRNRREGQHEIRKDILKLI